eukprot:98260-Hanusia_phi.AAC.1
MKRFRRRALVHTARRQGRSDRLARRCRASEAGRGQWATTRTVSGQALALGIARTKADGGRSKAERADGSVYGACGH